MSHLRKKTVIYLSELYSEDMANSGLPLNLQVRLLLLRKLAEEGFSFPETPHGLFLAKPWRITRLANGGISYVQDLGEPENAILEE